jgi:hypothetical protein
MYDRVQARQAATECPQRKWVVDMANDHVEAGVTILVLK